MKSKILQLVKKARKVAMAVEDGLQSDELTAAADLAQKEYELEVSASIMVREALITSNKSIIEAVMALTNYDTEAKMKVIKEAQRVIGIAEKSISIYKEIQDELKQSA